MTIVGMNPCHSRNTYVYTLVANQKKVNNESIRLFSIENTHGIDWYCVIPYKICLRDQENANTRPERSWFDAYNCGWNVRRHDRPLKSANRNKWKSM